MERLTEWNDEQNRHAYYPRCFKDPCYGNGCKIMDEGKITEESAIRAGAMAASELWLKEVNNA